MSPQPEFEIVIKYKYVPDPQDYDAWSSLDEALAVDVTALENNILHLQDQGLLIPKNADISGKVIE